MYSTHKSGFAGKNRSPNNKVFRAGGMFSIENFDVDDDDVDVDEDGVDDNCDRLWDGGIGSR